MRPFLPCFQSGVRAVAPCDSSWQSSTHQASQAFLFLLFALSPPPRRWSSCSSIPPGTMGECCASKPQGTHDAAKVGVSDDEPKHAVSSAAAAQQGTCPSTPLLLLRVFWRSWPERAMQCVFGEGGESWPRLLFWFSPTCQMYPSTQTFLLTGSDGCWSASLSVPFPPHRATPPPPCPLAGWHGWGAGTRVEAEVSVHASETWLNFRYKGLTVTPNSKGCSLLVSLNLGSNELTVPPDLTGCPNLEVFEGGMA